MGYIPNLMNMFKGWAGGATSAPAKGNQMVPLSDLSKEDLDKWKLESGDYDPDSEKGSQTQYANAYGSQQGLMLGQGGDPKKDMGTIWDQLKGGAKKFGKGIQDWDQRMDKKYQESGWAPETAENPYGSPESKEPFTPGGTVMGQDLEDASTDDASLKANVTSQVDWQNSPEGRKYLEQMNQAKQGGDYAAGQGMGQAGMYGMGGGLFGGLMNRMMGRAKPWEYQVKSKHKYMGYED